VRKGARGVEVAQVDLQHVVVQKRDRYLVMSQDDKQKEDGAQPTNGGRIENRKANRSFRLLPLDGGATLDRAKR
jgi:hypothetical protein